MRPSEKLQEPDWVDVLGVMQYIEEHYAEAPVWSVSYEPSRGFDAMLCITYSAACKRHKHLSQARVIFQPLTQQSLQRLSRTIYHALLDVQEEIDGGCLVCCELARARIN